MQPTTWSLRSKKAPSVRPLLSFFLLALLLSACGTKSGKFRLEGRLRNINQAEFWVYSPDGLIIGIDTIKVRDGRFSYELNMEHQSEGTLVVIFPNYSEQPVFAESGSRVSIKGDATHMKEMIIEGTDDNEDLTTLRMELNDLTPPDIPGAVSRFIKDNRSSRASVYLLQRYFVQSQEPDFRQARILAEQLLQEQPDNVELQRLKKQLPRLEACGLGARVPRFSATDVKGRKVTEKTLAGKVGVVMTLATWSYASTSQQQSLQKLKKTYGDRLQVISISLDGCQEDCRRVVRRDSVNWPTVCDGKMWDTPLLAKFGLGDVPANVLIDAKGKVVARNLSTRDLEERIRKLLK